MELLLEVRIFSALALLTEELRFEVEIRVLSPFFRDLTLSLIWEAVYWICALRFAPGPSAAF